MNLILYSRKQRPREIKPFAWGHTAAKKWICDLNGTLTMVSCYLAADPTVCRDLLGT